MKTTKLKVYEAPKAEVMEIEAQGVLCSSALMGMSLEGVTTETFSVP